MNTTVSTNVTAGLGGFLAFFLLAVALWLLMRNMNARLRRMSFREEAEARAAQGGPAGGAPAPRGDTDEDEAAGSVSARDDDAEGGTGRDQEPGAAGGPGVA
ncbi:hypothetical protein [Oryzihumus leptocrescens]|uniref:Uncharacterized protein n=1 Tax=Oryzihumus leptocrescens TaxID=297536 RepID=A0A542ZFL5_9MICO|nr:hypothetical protein [Oryzihumus leptocrescens]TQL59124.1 hypothetical protein FB474_0471 [Oryzihumus leptocrescens]